MIKAVIFDWGGVLIDNPTNGLLTYCANALGVPAERLKNAFSDYETSFQKGLLPEHELWKQMCRSLHADEPTSPSLWKEAVKSVFKDKKETYQLTQDLRSQGYRLGFLSNTEPPTMSYFYEQGYDKYFDVNIFSCAEKTVKPEEKIYRLTLQRLNTKPQEAIFIDDKRENIEGAKKVGINGILFTTIPQLKKELAALSVKTH